MCQLFTSNLVTRSASAEYAADADRSVGDVEYTRVGAVPEREVFDSADSMYIVTQFLFALHCHVIEWYDYEICAVCKFCSKL